MRITTYPLLRAMAFGAALAAAGQAAADSVLHDGDCIIIKFDEPVVPQSACRMRETASAADKKTNLFTITGDDAHPPVVAWQDQNRLRISFPKGSSCATQYRLRFFPGCGKYLSEKPMHKTDFTFRRPPSRLTVRSVAGMQAGSFIVFPRDGYGNDSRESLDFGTGSGVTYTYRRVNTTKNDKGYWTTTYGESVPAQLAPAQLKHGLPSVAIGRLAEQKADWEALTPESPLPGVVLVQPQNPLPEGSEWELLCDSAANKGFVSDRLSTFEAHQGLTSNASASYHNTGDGKAPGLEVHISFSAPITHEEARRVFREAVFAVGDARAVNNEDGTCKTLKVGDKEYQFHLGEMTRVAQETRMYTNLRDIEESGIPLGYTPQGICNAFTVNVTGPTPLLLDIRLPQGVTTALGQKSDKAQSHRLTLNPAWPRLQDAVGAYQHQNNWRNSVPTTTLLPLAGEHKVVVPLDNTSALRTTAYRIPADMAASRQEDLKNALQPDSRGREIVQLKRELERHTHGIEILKAKELLELRVGLDKLIFSKPDPAARRIISKLSGTPERDIEFPPCDSPDCGTTEAVVDLDAVLGAPATPGFYLLRLSAVASPAVCAALKDLGLAENTLDNDRYFLLQVSDLRLSYDDERMLLTRLSDGKPVPQAKVTVYQQTYDDNYAATPLTFELKDGFADLQKTRLPKAQCCFLVESEGDCALQDARIYNRERGVEHRSVMQTDRTLYRPGDEVRVRGIFRSYDEGKACPVTAPREGAPLTFSVRAPSGKELLKRNIVLDSVGAFSESFTLPAGEEDVTGRYVINVSSPDGWSQRTTVQSEVFRRDSFQVKTELEMDPVAPQQFTLRITATDYNATPVAKGKVQLQYRSAIPLLSLGEKTFPAPVEGAPRACEGEVELTTDADGKAELKGAFAPVLPTDSGSLSFSGSVSNDREEHVVLPSQGKGISPADFQFSNWGDTLTLRDATTGKVLAREQSVHARLLYTAREERTTPNGFRFVTIKPDVLLAEKDVTVPADCREGVELGLEKLWRDFAEQHREVADADAPTYVFSGTDPQGRKVESRNSRYFGYMTRDEEKAITVSGDSAEVKDGQLQVDMKFLRAGTACFLISHGKSVTPVLREVQCGQQTISLPLDGKEGLVRVQALIIHPDAAGHFTRAEVHDASASIPCATYALGAQLQLPDKPVRPGSALHVSGKVTDKDGKGTPAVVTLFAVDKGMLSLSGYVVPDLAMHFTTPHYARSFSDSFTFIPVVKVKQRHHSMLPGIWGGDDFCTDDDDDDDSLMVNECAAAPCAAPAPCAGAAKASFDCYDADEEAAPQVVVDTAVRSAKRAKMLASVDATWSAEETEGLGLGGSAAGTAPRLRTDFNPVAFWLGAVETDAEGHFSADVAKLPDTLTTYCVYAFVLGKNGTHFGNAEAEVTVNQELMLSPGTPLFMSTGDTLRLPLNITNAAGQSGTWKVAFSGEGDTQQIRLDAGKSGTLYFDYTATGEGEVALDWTATGQEGAASDAVQARFPVRYPAPLLKEAHHLVLEAGQELKPASLLAPELAGSTRGGMEIQLSANPLLHLAGCMDFLLAYPYGCTEQTASGLLPWLFYDRLAPISPLMAQTSPAMVHEIIHKSVEKIFSRQRQDGGLSYWDKGESCGWASAYAGLVMTIAKEQGVPVPEDKMEALRGFLCKHLAELRKSEHYPDNVSALTLFGIGRTTGDDALTTEAVELALGREPGRCFGCFWHQDTRADLQMIADLRRKPQDKHSAFLQWMRARGHDYRHTTTWRSGWMLIALHEYLRLTPASDTEATVQMQDGTSLTLDQGVTTLHPQGKPLSSIPTGLKGTAGTAYAVVKVKAQPEQTEYPGVTEKGLQITRIYEKKGADGIWREATEFAVGDVVRVTLTCAKMADELEYFVLEDYLPSCMEAVNPNVPSQAAGLEWRPWSRWFDHKEYLADRVRGFCTRWGGRDLLNMSYYARVKRAGTATAPPAQAQLMYEPQTYGLSPNKKIDTTR